jgi:hypothetical protein
LFAHHVQKKRELGVVIFLTIGANATATTKSNIKLAPIHWMGFFNDCTKREAPPCSIILGEHTTFSYPKGAGARACAGYLLNFVNLVNPVQKMSLLPIPLIPLFRQNSVRRFPHYPKNPKRLIFLSVLVGLSRIALPPSRISMRISVKRIAVMAESSHGNARRR